MICSINELSLSSAPVLRPSHALHLADFAHKGASLIAKFLIASNLDQIL